MPKILVMPRLSVEVVTGETCYPAEGGFSAITTEVAPEDARLIAELSYVQEHREAVTLRCAMLDVTGKITKCRSEGGRKVFVLLVDDLVYRKPLRV